MSNSEKVVKRVRKPRKKKEEQSIQQSIQESVQESVQTIEVKKPPKKRGRKPKGGKIVDIIEQTDKIVVPEPNIILHLHCGLSDIESSEFIENNLNTKQSTIETFQFNNDKLNFETLPLSKKTLFKTTNTPQELNDTITDKLKQLAINLHTNNISDKKSACFWCTCEFDNPSIYIPKFELDGSYHVYGCFCSPECACGHLFNDSRLSTSVKFERYHLLNYLYCKIYDYKKNIKPAPDPYHTLEKYYGNMTIQEYRHMLKNERVLLVVDKPLTRSLPEIHEDNDDYLLSAKSMSATSKYRLRRSTNKPSKNDIISNTFKLG
tara:strand:- start:184 stop:1143 length:960 start_codon:yes stop_codon:yes gene_type:complete